MTNEERRAIEHECARLVAHYANRNDAADWEAVAALYAEDGRMTRPSAPDLWIVGREAILASFRDRVSRRGRHLCTNVVIDVLAPSSARGECAIGLFVEGREPFVGTYQDRFVRTDEGWRFLERRGSLAY